eukprot:snap_masked-scaffold_3-processed-gene-5.21-mRNA-1 protein AED:1.00 eAED:1.00 QI:0/-1/0/0/-1/1/1/0/380
MSYSEAKKKSVFSMKSLPSLRSKAGNSLDSSTVTSDQSKGTNRRNRFRTLKGLFKSRQNFENKEPIPVEHFPTFPRSNFPMLSAISIAEATHKTVNIDINYPILTSEVSFSVKSSETDKSVLLTTFNLLKFTKQTAASISVGNGVVILSKIDALEDEQENIITDISDVSSLSLHSNKTSFEFSTVQGKVYNIKTNQNSTSSALKIAQSIICCARSYLEVLKVVLQKVLPRDVVKNITAAKFNAKYKLPKLARWKVVSAELIIRTMLSCARLAYDPSMDLIHYLTYMRHILSFTGRMQEGNFYLAEVNDILETQEQARKIGRRDFIRNPEVLEDKLYMRDKSVLALGGKEEEETRTAEVFAYAQTTAQRLASQGFAAVEAI